MIKINFLQTYKTKNQVIVLGVDIMNINWLLVSIAIIFYLSAPSLMQSFFAPRIAVLQNTSKQIKHKIRKMKISLKKNNKLKLEIDKFEKEKKNLERIKTTIQTILSTKKNAFPLMYFLAKSLPVNIWFESLIVKDDSVFIDGIALNNTVIADYMASLNKSYFFKQGDVELNFKKISKEELKKKKSYKQVNFTIKAKINSYGE